MSWKHTKSTVGELGSSRACSKGHDIGSCLLPPGPKLCKAPEAGFTVPKRVLTTLNSLMDLSLTYVDSKIYQLWLVLDWASNSRLLFCTSAHRGGPCLRVQRFATHFLIGSSRVSVKFAAAAASEAPPSSTCRTRSCRRAAFGVSVGYLSVHPSHVLYE